AWEGAFCGAPVGAANFDERFNPYYKICYHYGESLMPRASRVDGVRFSNYPPTSRGRALFALPLWGQQTPMKDSIHTIKSAITMANL
ncbi:MAG: hypothetical protein IJF45_02775, partial [Clostridia bacterium]|nr:hypothetical protein [Clostridia bacterium]